MNRKSLTAQIHIAKKDLGLDDATYRQALSKATGHSSCTDMQLLDLFNAVQWFKEHGWKPKPSTRRVSPSSRHKPRHAKTQKDKLRALWIDMGKQGIVTDASEKALGNWVNRMTRTATHPGYKTPEFCPPGVLHGLIEQLKKWQKRETTKCN